MTGGYLLSSYPPTRWIPFVRTFPNTMKVFSEIMRKSIVCVFVCVCVCEREREREIDKAYYKVFPYLFSIQVFSSVQSLSCVRLFATPWITACQASLSITSSRVHPNPCPLSQWCHPTISSSVIPFSSCAQSFPASGSFQMSQLFTSGGQSIRVSASTSVLPMNM